MSRAIGIWILCGFALAFSAVAIWGVADIAGWLTAMSDCAGAITIDTSSFWFVGALSVVGLPLLAVFHTPSSQKLLFAVLVVWFVSAPLIGYQYFFWRANAHGYEASSATSPFQLDRAKLINQGCASKMHGAER